MGVSTAELELLFENAPRFVRRLAGEPAKSWADLLDRAERIAREMPEAEQLELIDGHPRIGADPAVVSEQSFREQGYDRSPAPSDDGLAARLAALNDDYERTFGFRFVVFVAGRARAEIAEAMAARMGATRDEELRRALRDVFAIARERARKRGLIAEEGR